MYKFPGRPHFGSYDVTVSFIITKWRLQNSLQISPHLMLHSHLCEQNSTEKIILNNYYYHLLHLWGFISTNWVIPGQTMT